MAFWMPQHLAQPVYHGGQFISPQFSAPGQQVPLPQLPPGAIPMGNQPFQPTALPEGWVQHPMGGLQHPAFCGAHVQPVGFSVPQFDDVQPQAHPNWPQDPPAGYHQRNQGTPRIATSRGFFFANDPALYEDEDYDENEPYPETVHGPNDLPAPANWGQVPEPPPNWGAVNQGTQTQNPYVAGGNILGPQIHRRNSNANVAARDASELPLSSWQIVTDTEYNPTNLAPRPRNWRPGFDLHPKSLLAKYIQKFPCWSPDRNATIFPKTNISPLLRYTGLNTYPIQYNLGRKYQDYLPFNMIAKRHFHDFDFIQLATNPPVDFLRIVHPSLPWCIDVQTRNGVGLTIAEVIEGIYLSLNKPITSKEFYTEALDSVDREIITHAFSQRCEGNLGEIKQGITRADYLGPEVWFVCLERGKHGWWIMKTLPVSEEGDL